MRILEYPFILIAALVFCLFILGGVVIYLTARGLKTANYEEKNDFAKLSRMESRFAKAGRPRDNRSVMYISVFMDNYRSLYPGEKTNKIAAVIKRALLSSFSPTQTGYIATYGDNAYVAFSTLNLQEIRNIVDDFHASLNKSFTDSGALNLIDVKVGMYYSLGSDITFDEAISRAKRACILAKNAKLPYVEWDAGSGKALEKKIKIENNIENEIDNNRFFLVYQPVLDAQTKEIIGAEVLSRLKSVSDGIIQPGSFLSAVNSVGLNNKFDYYIFEKNCKWISTDKMQREGYKYTINFSRSTLCEPEFVEKLLSIAEKYQLNASCLAVEILEDTRITEEAKVQMKENLTALKEKGISILLDDFGSGESTFGDLQNLDISIVKIDRAITKNAVTENGYIILENIVRMAKSIGFKTLCEGVETREEEAAAIRAGCDLLQGFYYYRPMPALMLESLLEQGKQELDDMHW